MRVYIRSQGGSEYVQLKWIEKWSGEMPQYLSNGSNGGSLIMLPNDKKEVSSSK